jgi:hypothetical protein
VNYPVFEVEIKSGILIVTDSENLPTTGRGLLVIFPPTMTSTEPASRKRIKLPLIHGDGTIQIDPSRETLDAGLWD